MSVSRRALLFRCAVVVCPLLLSCSSSEEAGGAGAGGAGGVGGGAGAGGGAGGGTSLQCDSTSTLDLTGTWAIFFQYSIGLKNQEGGAIKMCPVTQISSSTMLLLLDITQTGTALEMKPVNCTLTLPEVKGIAGDCDPNADNVVTVEILAPQTLVDAMPDTKMLSAKGALSGTAPGSTLSMTDRFDFLTGSTKGVPNLPTWVDTQAGCGAKDDKVGRDGKCLDTCVSDCSSLVDSDNDGKDGVTFYVCGTTKDDRNSKVECQHEDPSQAGTTLQGKAYLDFETDPRITGTVKSNCEASGTFEATTTYHLVGANLYLANTPVSVASSIKSLPTYEISSTESKFRMIRVDGKHGGPDWKLNLSDSRASCKVAIQHQNELQ